MPFPRASALIILTVCAGVTAVLYLAKPVLMPIALAVLLAFLLNPVVRLLERFASRGVAVAVVVVLTFSALGAASWALSWQLSSLANELPKYRANIMGRIADIRGASRGGAIEHLQSTARDVMQELNKDASGRQKAPPERVVVREPGAPRSLTALPGAAAPFVEALVQAGFVVALVGFFLARRQDLRNRLIRLVGESRLTLATKAVDEAAERIGRYLVALATVNIAFGIAVGAGLAVIGLPYALVWAVLAALLRFIPYVGVWTAALMPIALALAVFPGWQKPLLVGGLFAVLEPLVFLVLEPLVYRHRVGVSEIGLLVAVAFWTWLWGPIGLVLAVPLTVAVVVVGKYVPQASFLEILIGEAPDVDPALTCYQRLLAGDTDEAIDIVEAHLDAERPAAVYDATLLPALAYARRERVADRISDDDRRLVLRGVRDAVDAIAGPPPAPTPGGRRLIGCPVRDETDETAFVMLRHLLDPREWSLELASAAMLSSEVVELVSANAPALICVGAVGRGTLAQTRYLTKRLRAVVGDATILVGQWGGGPLSAEERSALIAAGATDVGVTLEETCAQLARAGALVGASRTAA